MGLLVCSRGEVMKVIGKHYRGVTEVVVGHYCAGPAQQNTLNCSHQDRKR